jgi:DNA-binding protein HU-alpha
MATKTVSKATAKPADTPADADLEEGGDGKVVKFAGLRLKELIDRIVDTSGAKRKDVKPIVEAALVEIDKALAKGEVLNLPGLGKLRVVRAASEPGGAMTLKLRKQTGAEGKSKTGKDTLAEGEE